MPTFTAEQLTQIGTLVFTAAGAPEETARIVADSLAQSNLRGHDSHGIMRLHQYMRPIRSGSCVPDALPRIAKETPTTALVDGCNAFGVVTARFATDVLVRKAKESQVASVGIVRCNHLGRLGEYAELAADQGIIAMMTLCNSGKSSGVAPFGGAKPALATNPYAFGVPAGQYPSIIADFASSTAASGKVSVYRDSGKQLPKGWILDKNGQASTDPNDLYDGGMLLPAAGHKGYALALVAEALGGALTGATEFAAGEPFYNCVFMWGIRTDVFQSTEEYERIEDISIAKSLQTPPLPGFEKVMMPGDPERLAKARREKEGISVPEETWNNIKTLADELGVLDEVVATAS